MATTPEALAVSSGFLLVLSRKVPAGVRAMTVAIPVDDIAILMLAAFH